jgi:sulfoxide reductase heme-binding subunit YedZ
MPLHDGAGLPGATFSFAAPAPLLLRPDAAQLWDWTMNALALWRDRRGRVSALRVASLALLLWPAVLAAFVALRYGLGARPLNDLIHRAGYWALIFLLLSLAITPLRQAGRYGKLVDVRRMIGVGAFVYAAVHLGLYIADQGFDLVHVALEIARRIYLLIGFVALLGLTVLAITSTDTMVKRLGGLRWRRLHQITHGIGLLALIHFFQQTKADVTVPTLYAGLFAWLIGYRLLAGWRGQNALSAPWLAALAVAAGLLTLVGEAIGIGLSFGVSPLTILATALDTDLGIRPGWTVMGAGLLVAILDLVRGWSQNRAAPPAPSAKPAIKAAAE